MVILPQAGGGNPEGYDISYNVAIYKYKNCGVSEWKNVCIDNYNDYEDDADEEYNTPSTTKGTIFDIDLQHKNNIKKCMSNCIGHDKERMDNIGDINYVHK